MTFGERPTADALGTTLAHSLKAGGLSLRKGRVLSAEDIATLLEAGVASVVVSALNDGDVAENAAAEHLAQAMVSPDISADAPFTGRANLVAASAGILRIDVPAINAINSVDEAITLATLPDFARVNAGQMVGTVKIIPYGVALSAVEKVTALAGSAVLRLHPFQEKSVKLILTQTDGFKPSLLSKAESVVRTRLGAMGLDGISTEVIPHKTEDVADAIRKAHEDMILILGASATSDRADVCPAGLVSAGGVLARFGMPVDPGNLLFLGEHHSRPVIGLPGCARSLALNGVDWVLERLTADIAVTSEDIAAMGAGGLLKEIPTRPQPRAGRTRIKTEPIVDVLILAAGGSSRMKGRDKLLEPVDGEPLLTRITKAATASRARATHVVLPRYDHPRNDALSGTGASVTIALDAQEGMAASLRAGLAAIDRQTDAVIVTLADMPEIGAETFNALIAAFKPEKDQTIVRATSADGTPGHPVLFGRQFFEPLSGLKGDVGARSVLDAARDFVVDVPLHGDAAITDLDTPEAWENWRARKA